MNDEQTTEHILDIIAKWISIDHLYDGTNDEELYTEEDIEYVMGNGETGS